LANRQVIPIEKAIFVQSPLGAREECRESGDMKTSFHSLNDLLKATSRSFYLTLRMLPGAIRPQIGLAYLLARAADTIADTEIVTVEQRLGMLRLLRERIAGAHQEPLDFGALAKQQGLPAERILLERCEEAVAVLEGFDSGDKKLIREVLATITSGQELDLQRFAGASEKNIVALKTSAELDDYTYRVAGCVGEFWTKMCRTHLFPQAILNETKLMADGVRFGKGLQLVNILRDLPKDLRQGRCYLPAEELAAAGLRPVDLLIPANESKLRSLYDRHLAVAEAHLQAGWDYTNALPGGCARVRLACAWPVLIGAETLRKLRTGNVLDARQRIKISRSQVWGMIIKSIIYYPMPVVCSDAVKIQAADTEIQARARELLRQKEAELNAQNVPPAVPIPAPSAVVVPVPVAPVAPAPVVVPVPVAPVVPPAPAPVPAAVIPDADKPATIPTAAAVPVAIPDANAPGTVPGNTLTPVSPTDQERLREATRKAIADLNAKNAASVPAVIPVAPIAPTAPVAPVVAVPAPVAPQYVPAPTVAIPAPDAATMRRVQAEQAAQAAAEEKAHHKAEAKLEAEKKKEAKAEAKAAKSQVAFTTPAVPVAQPLFPPADMAPGSKQARLYELLQRYQRDEVTPTEYHEARAKILAEP
jgi:farnesyl-diphosphate farnesyltransferase